MKKIFLSIAAYLFPMIAFAVDINRNNTQYIDSLGELVAYIINIFNLLVPFFISLGLLYFLWGVVQYVRNAGQEKARETGRDHMIYGIIGLTVMVSVWGLVNFTKAIFPLYNEQVTIPQFNPSKLQK